MAVAGAAAAKRRAGPGVATDGSELAESTPECKYRDDRLRVNFPELQTMLA
jgi:hypothetical protein